MKVRKMLLREETEKVLHTKSNGDRLVANSSGHGYSAYTRDNVHIGHIEADTDAAAVAEFSKKEPKYESMNEDYLNSPEYRIQRYEDDIPELFHRVHDGYMNGMVNAKAYADVLAKIYSVLEELDYVDESLKEGYMDTHEGVAHVDTLDLMAALKSVVKEYGHMELVTPMVCELHDDDHGRRLELFKSVDEGLVNEDSKVKNGKFAGNTINLNISPNMSGAASGNKLIDLPISAEVPVSANVPIDLGVDGASVGFLGGQAGQGGTIHDTTNEAADDDFMDAEKMEMSDFDSHVGKEEDIEFVMSEYIPDSYLIEFVKKVEKNKYLVGVEDEVVTVEFDPNWSEYVYTIEGKGPYSHSSYEFIARDVYDFVMARRPAPEYDDDFDDLSSFNECSEVKTADALYGVERDDTLTEARYSDTNGIMGKAGATYSDADLRKAWDEGKDNDPSMQAYNGDFDAWKKDTVANMSKNEAFDMSYGPDLGKLSWQVASYLDVDALGEDKWIEFICDDPRDVAGDRSTKVMRFEAIGEDAHKYGSIRTAGSRVEVKFRNGSEAMCDSAEEVARFVAGEFGISL